MGTCERDWNPFYESWDQKRIWRPGGWDLGGTKCLNENELICNRLMRTTVIFILSLPALFGLEFVIIRKWNKPLPTIPLHPGTSYSIKHKQSHEKKKIKVRKRLTMVVRARWRAIGLSVGIKNESSSGAGPGGSTTVFATEEIECCGLLGVVSFKETPRLSNTGTRDRSRCKGGMVTGTWYRGSERVETCWELRREVPSKEGTQEVIFVNNCLDSEGGFDMRRVLGVLSFCSMWVWGAGWVETVGLDSCSVCSWFWNEILWSGFEVRSKRPGFTVSVESRDCSPVFSILVFVWIYSSSSLVRDLFLFAVGDSTSRTDKETALLARIVSLISVLDVSIWSGKICRRGRMGKTAESIFVCCSCMNWRDLLCNRDCYYGQSFKWQ